MVLLGNINKSEEDIETHRNKYGYGVYKRDDNSFKYLLICLIISPILHALFIAIVAVVLFIFKLMGIELSLFDKPLAPPKDLEFVLVNKEAEPINKHTKNRAEKNSRAGGIHDPKRPVSQPTSGSAQPKPQRPTPPSKKVNKQPAKSSAKGTTQQNDKQVNKKPQTQQVPWAPKKTTSVPTAQGVPNTSAPAPKPALKPSAPKTVKPSGSINIPAPKTSLPKVAGPAGGPVTGAKVGSGSLSGGSGNGKSYSPAPSFSPSGAGSSSGGRFSPGGSGSVGSSGRSGNVGNPGPGNPKGAPGIDAIKQADFGPYMRDLQRKIKMNWDPPKGNESKRVVLLFTIARDGRLVSHRVYKSSGLPAADRAAMHAVELSAPFKPLPPEYKENTVDIQFTFDYNVFGVTSY